MNRDAASHEVLEREREVVIRLDRLILSADGRMSAGIKKIAGFDLTEDVRVRCQGKISTYARVRRFRSRNSSTQIVQQYKPQAPWLRPSRITIVGDDEHGITPEEIEAVLAHCISHKLSVVELAFDFLPRTGVDEAFVLQHGSFGKSRRRTDRGGPGHLRYGSRGSAKLVRCYQKRQLGCLRIELECHGALLKKYSVTKVRDLGVVAVKLFPAHIKFVGICWGKLEAYLARRFGVDGQLVAEEARWHAGFSLRRVARFLSRKGVPNPHRFLRRLRINRDVQSALRRWAARFSWNEDGDRIGR